MKRKVEWHSDDDTENDDTEEVEVDDPILDDLFVAIESLDTLEKDIRDSALAAALSSLCEIRDKKL